jgi:hypothetical protein
MHGDLPFGASQPSVPYGILSREAAVLELEIRTIVVAVHGVAGRHESCEVPGDCVEKIF